MHTKAMMRLKFILYFLVCFDFSVNAQLICFDFPADTFSVHGGPWKITTADFNGDKYDDLAIGLYDEHYFSIMLNDGTGHFQDFATYDVDPMLVMEIEAVKINNDDNIDLIVTGGYFWIFIYMGNGDGTFYRSSAPYIGSFSNDVVTGFFNQDSYIDIALIHRDSNTLSILFGEYTGTFHQVYSYYAFGAEPMKMVKGDFNEDGNDDLVICNYGMPNGTETSLVLFEGNGLGAFQPYVISEENYPESVAAGDFNRDGHQDIIFKRYDRWLFKLWGNGDGTFQEPEVQEISAIYYAVFLHSVDIDSDSSLDLAMGCHYFNMHLNDGKGNFEDTLFINEKSNYYRVGELTTGNFNGDAKPDIVSTHYDGGDWSYGSITVYLNCLPVGVQDAEIQDDVIGLYPSPGNGYLRIMSDPSLTDLKVNGIFNCQGMAIEESRYSVSGQYLNLSSLNPGLYIIQFASGNKMIAKKVVIN